ncbi:MAG: hypothetical protein LBC19_05015 [Tannerella sp.]|jgi:hypothetical protein|nr:hypothetical protein [Tannerella sp.]
MLGFEIDFNGETIRSRVDRGLMEVIFTSGGLSKTDDLYIWGLMSFHIVKWYASRIDADKITIRIVDIDRNSELIQKENRFKDDEAMLQRYYDLKQELEKLGLL